MALPISIDPCPIVEAVLEVRFDTTVPKSAVYGIFYNELSSWFSSKPKDLPIQQIPEQLRQKDPSFKHKPYYQFEKDNLIIQIGPDVCLISMTKNYTGWKEFSKNIYHFLNLMFKPNIISSFSRVGFRYINFFEDEIYNSINLDVHLNGKPIDYDNTVLSTSFSHENFKSTLRISNNSFINTKKGSIIDIDTFIDKKIDVEDFISSHKDLIEEGHNCEKELFYSLLKENFLEKLNPKYH